MVSGHLTKQPQHRLLERDNPVAHHILRITTVNVFAKLVNSGHELYVLLCDRVHRWLRVLFEEARGCSRKSVDVKLEHRCEFWPQNHAYSVVIKVQHRNLKALLHQAPEILVQLNAQEKSENILTSNLRGGQGSCLMHVRNSLEDNV